MATPKRSDPSLVLLRERLAVGDMTGARAALMRLTPEGRGELEQRLGPETVKRMMSAARGVRRAVRGRVVVIHGIMGGKLATKDRAGDEDLVWVNVLRLFNGRIADFTLDAEGNQADPELEVMTCGLLDEYLPLLVELSGTWDVLPFAFDWRLDIDAAARLLDKAIREWARGQPAHIIAHSMGGLVSRRFIQAHPETWKSMADGNRLRQGGRLVMLGTPNRGSFAIPFVLTGKEKTVQRLATLDRKHDLKELLDIIDTFVGSYQMMPSPLREFGDDRKELYRRESWGSYPVTQALLDRGRQFQENLDEVIDPARLVYVAGYDQPTPYRIRVDGPGDFSYQETNDGDGRVPHELGLLPDVRAFFVREKHGDLPANERVLAAIHELLETGATPALESRVPVERRGLRSTKWRKADEIAPIAAAVEVLPAIPAGTRKLPALLPGDAEKIEALLVESFAGTGERPGARGAAEKKARAAAHTPAAPIPPVKVEVMWGDICLAEGEIYAVGHYQGVVPQFAEYALDRMVSGIPPGEPNPVDPRRLVITSLAKRGMIRAAVGDVSFFPWMTAGRKCTAIAGMGHPGTFHKPELQRMARSLTECVTALPGVATVNTVLIGSGVGNLPVPAALDALLGGMIEALSSGARSASIGKVRIVERDWRQAREIHATLVALLENREDLKAVRLAREVVTGKGGVYGKDIHLCSVIAAAAKRSRGGAPGRKSITSLLRAIPDAGLRREASERLDEVETSGAFLDIVAGLNLEKGRPRDGRADDVPPTRISFISEPGGARAAAISNTAVVAERLLGFNWKLLDDLVVSMTDPDDVSRIPDDAALLFGFVVPNDFRKQLQVPAPTIFEVDRTAARIHWEMLATPGDEGDTPEPIALKRSVARQLRTAYSPPPSREVAPGPKLRALVIGDPGDPERRYDLPEARREAVEVYKLLTERGVETTALIGAPNLPRTEDLLEFKPVTMLDVLRLLRTKQFDILHYAGHGDFDPDDPEHRAGWLFGTEFFTSRELGCIDNMPRLVVANACLTGLLSERTGDGKAGSTRPRLADASLLPGLADEFLKRGVRNYVGTAWPVNDAGAVKFATTLYGALLDPTHKENLGEAIRKARVQLKSDEAEYGALWAAYQHYGDPSFRLDSVADTRADSDRAKTAASRRTSRRRTARSTAAKRRTTRR